MSNVIALEPGLNGAGAIPDGCVEILVSFDIRTIGEGAQRRARPDSRRRA